MIQTGILKLKRKAGIRRNYSVFHVKPLILWAGLVGLVYLFVVQDTSYGSAGVMEVRKGSSNYLREELEEDEIQYEGIDKIS